MNPPAPEHGCVLEAGEDRTSLAPSRLKVRVQGLTLGLRLGLGLGRFSYGSEGAYRGHSPQADR